MKTWALIFGSSCWYMGLMARSPFKVLKAHSLTWTSSR